MQKKNAVHLKHFDMGHVNMHGFHGNPLYDFREGEVGLLIQSYLGFFLSQSTKIVVKLKLKHMSFFLCQRCKSTNSHIYEY